MICAIHEIPVDEKNNGERDWQIIWNNCEL